MKIALVLVVAAAAVVSASGPPGGTSQDPTSYLCQLFLGGSQFCPATSCSEIAENRRWDARDGYFWLAMRDTAFQFFCADSIAPTESRGWRRVGYIEPHTSCPSGLEYFSVDNWKVCRKTVDVGCSSVTLNTYRLSYSKVCGLVLGFPRATVDGFEKYGVCQECTIDQPYMDGVSITYGSPRKHIWTLAASSFSPSTQCPCSDHSRVTVPSFVGNDYYCDVRGINDYSEKLWHGTRCVTGGKRCCERAGWFCKELPEPTNEDIELRLCTDQSRTDEDIYINYAEIYVQ